MNGFVTRLNDSEFKVAWKMKYVLTFDNQERQIKSLIELEEIIGSIKEVEFAEIWLNQNKGAALCVLVNKDKSFLMFLRENGDPGFSSRNLNYKGLPNSEIYFQLDNGQKDTYPESWCLQTKQAIKALGHFFEFGEKPDWIYWHED